MQNFWRDKQGVLWVCESSELVVTFLIVKWALFLFFTVFYFIYFFFHILALEDQLQQAKQHAEQYKSMSEANESALSDLNKVGNKRNVFSRILEKYSSRKASLYFFVTWKISAVTK